MSTGLPQPIEQIEYPDSDGEPMSDNTLQWDWMVKIVSELRVMYTGQNVFVAGDLLWYPVQGSPKTRLAPDGMVAFGRPPGYRGSYKQWEEAGIAPQVIFEVLSPRNTYDEMIDKKDWYSRYGAEEFYIIDPYEHHVEGYRRDGDQLMPIARMNGHVSPRLGIKFMTTHEGLIILTPEGREFQSREEHVDELNEELARIDAEREAAEVKLEAAQRDAQEAVRQVEAERFAKERLSAKLREMGIDPEAVLRANTSGES